ncbi:hypothetical protein ABID08_001140 [Rhizobium binae]|uniref:Uncharacterized protein n=1 Tax=Rhizobium binae TaxID=1138190 RepID=A0ABV2ME69_9HYPH
MALGHEVRLIALVDDDDHDLIPPLARSALLPLIGSCGRRTRRSASWIAKFMLGIARTN